MFDRLSLMEKRYEEINNLLMDPKVVSNVSEMTKLLKEQKSLVKAVLDYRKYKEIEKQIKSLEPLIHSDDELAEMASLEKDELEEKLNNLLDELKILLLPKDPNDERNVIVEIKGAAGGDEGNIFAGDLFRMYSKYAIENNWKIEVLNAMEGAMGGFTSIEFLVSGDSVYSFLKYEAGVHRVQRVPETESQGRIHTSTATVLVMPEADDIDIKIEEKDIKVDTYRASGAGGQHVNKTDSAVRMTHIPTGIVVTCQDGRSQIENREKALTILRTKIYDEMTRRAEAERGAERKSKIGTGDRSEKIRTYNYPQNRVTDHRINYTVNQLDRIINGDLTDLIDSLINEDQKLKLSGMSL